MKKILALVCFLVGVAACATQPPGNKDTMSNANKGGEMKSTAAPSEADIIAKEKAGWDAIKKKDWDALGKMLASDFIDVEDDGVYDKAGSIASLKDYDLSDITYSDWKMLTIDKDARPLSRRSSLCKSRWRVVGNLLPADTRANNAAAAIANRESTREIGGHSRHEDGGCRTRPDR